MAQCCNGNHQQYNLWWSNQELSICPLNRVQNQLSAFRQWKIKENHDIKSKFAQKLYSERMWYVYITSNGSWCMGIKGEMSGTVCVTFTWWYVWCFEWASGNQEEVQACLVTLWLFIISCYSLYKTTLGLLCSWFENNPHFHKYSMDFHV